jgi:hypothetical protein
MPKLYSELGVQKFNMTQYKRFLLTGEAKILAQHAAISAGATALPNMTDRALKQQHH